VDFRYIGTAGLIAHLLEVGLLSRVEAETIVRGLPAKDFYIDPGTIEDVLRSRRLESDG
jgi:predicted nucleic acid-binding protein